MNHREVVEIDADATDHTAHDQLRVSVEIVELKDAARAEQDHDQRDTHDKPDCRQQPGVDREPGAQEADDQRVGDKEAGRQDHRA